MSLEGMATWVRGIGGMIMFEDRAFEQWLYMVEDNANLLTQAVLQESSVYSK